jgi:glutaredoxin
MKKLLVGLIAFLSVFTVVSAAKKTTTTEDTSDDVAVTETTTASNLVKVYIFGAGGCPWCEKEEEYLKALDSYGVKFEIVDKELYVDHVDWAQGADYKLGKTVAETFLDAGFENASYQGTPFVVISDIYAAAAYSEDLETYINQAYEEGDQDAVSCIEAGNENCIRANATSAEEESSDTAIIIIIAVIIIGGFAGLALYSKKE